MNVKYVEFLTTMPVQDLQPTDKWVLIEDFNVKVTNDDGTEVMVTVPKGYSTDFCSIPRAPFIYEEYGGKAVRAGAIHDFLYTVADYPRLWCDQVLRAAIIAQGYPESMADAFYAAVRMFASNHYGFIRQLKDKRDIVYKAERPIPLPPAMDLRPFCPPIYDQLELGGCVGNAIAFAIHFDRMKQGITPDFIPSRLFIYFNARRMEGTIQSDAGCQIRDGIKGVALYGDCPESNQIPGFPGWNYTIKDFAAWPPKVCYKLGLKYKAVNYAAVPQTEQGIKQCLTEGYPVIFGFSVYESFESEEVARTGIVPMPGPDEKMLGGHCVAITGFDDSTKMFQIRNSWGAGWADKGTCYMPYAFVTDNQTASDFWTIRLIAG